MGGELSRPKETLDGTGLLGARKRIGKNEYVYCYIPAAKAKGEFQVISHDGDEEYSPKVGDAATLAVYQEVGVILETHTVAGYAWVQVAGVCEALVDGTTDVAKDDYLEVLNGAVNAVKDGTARSVNSVAIAREAQATDEGTLTDVELLGGRVIVAAT
jgi:hypothetical protein